eukprot:gnl/Dysnectes_brevis/2420_a2873_611.p1 GENE.gnl/Dysnectes_brevis/2420_a2873_611~~gnl/Dysnectes_brevis/2420_a2873_611.p1  ORF type:complete len:609 (-),score=223.87 gnl/Dysnectes_brevis/2420_a2873_611:2-1828(-)
MGRKTRDRHPELYKERSDRLKELKKRPRSNREKRRLQALKRKELAGERNQILELIKESNLSKDTFSVLKPISKLGQRLSNKEQQQIALKKQQMGVSISKEEIRVLESHTIEEEEEPVIEDTIMTEANEEAQVDRPATPTQDSAELFKAKPRKYLRHTAQGDTPPSSPVSKEAAVFPEAMCPPAPQTLPRPESMAAHRSSLPVAMHEGELLELMARHDVVVVSAETGSGKTSQIPQLLLENGYAGASRYSGPVPHRAGFSGQALITQPRRIAAISSAGRVGLEMGDRDLVGYVVRHDSRVHRDARLIFCTEGVLLRLLQDDFMLSKYSAIVLDEAHERTLALDLAIGLLSRVVRLRRKRWSAEASPSTSTAPGPLKLVIMSATLRTSDFTENPRLFSPAPPLLAVPGRQFPVLVHFATATAPDYVQAAAEKVVWIHKHKPGGKVLVFLTGTGDIRRCEALIHELLGEAAEESSVDEDDYDDDFQEEGLETTVSRVPFNPSTDLMASQDNEAAAAKLGLLTSQAGDEYTTVIGGTITEDDKDKKDKKDKKEHKVGPPRKAPFVYTLPLFAALPLEEQQKVFDDPPEDHRLVVLATNVAESSLTIPGCRGW